MMAVVVIVMATTRIMVTDLLEYVGSVFKRRSGYLWLAALCIFLAIPRNNYFLRRGGVGVGDDTADMQAATQGVQGECGRGRQRCESVAVVNVFSTEPRPPPLDL